MVVQCKNYYIYNDVIWICEHYSFVQRDLTFRKKKWYEGEKESDVKMLTGVYKKKDSEVLFLFINFYFIRKKLRNPSILTNNNNRDKLKNIKMFNCVAVSTFAYCEWCMFTFCK